MEELLLLEQINQWLGVLGTHIEWRRPTYQTIEYFAHAWLTWDDSRGSKTNFLKFTAATFTKCTCIRGSHSFHQTNTSWASMKKMLSKVSNTSWMFNMNQGGDKMLLMGSTTTHRNFHITGLPPSCERDDSIGQTKRYNGVYSRDQPWVRQHYEYRWFWSDWMIAHTQSKVWVR